MAFVVDAAGSDGEQVQTAEQSTEQGLRVRLLEARDAEVVRDIIKQHHATTVFRDQAFSDWKLNEHFSPILSRPPRMVCPVVTLDGKPIGVAWAIADSYMLSDGPLFVTVPGVRRAKAFLALVAAIRQWADSLHASHSFVHVTTGSSIEATDRLLKALRPKFMGGA